MKLREDGSMRKKMVYGIILANLITQAFLTPSEAIALENSAIKNNVGQVSSRALVQGGFWSNLPGESEDYIPVTIDLSKPIEENLVSVSYSMLSSGEITEGYTDNTITNVFGTELVTFEFYPEIVNDPYDSYEILYTADGENYSTEKPALDSLVGYKVVQLKVLETEILEEVLRVSYVLRPNYETILENNLLNQIIGVQDTSFLNQQLEFNFIQTVEVGKDVQKGQFIVDLFPKNN